MSYDDADDAMTDNPEMIPTLLNNRYPLLLPPHRANWPPWTTPPYWESERLSHMFDNIRPNDIVVDIGAEEGDITSLCASWAHRGGVVIIEPQPRVWPNIRTIFSANNLRPPLAYWVGFASDTTLERPDKLDIDQSNHEGWPICAYGPVITDNGFRVLADQEDSTPQIRLDDLLWQRNIRPDVITIDVEGAELRVLRGAEQMLRLARPIVYCSVHGDFMRDTYHQDEQELHDFMRSMGYTGILLATDHEDHVCYYHPQGRRIFSNVH